MKKQILIVAGIATFAVGAAFAGKAKSEKSLNIEARPLSAPNQPCETEVPCHPDASATCEISGVKYESFNQQTGMCNQPLALD